MENRVGDNVPTPAKLAALLKQLQDVVAEIKKFGEAMQRLIYAIAQKRGLKIEGFPLAGMLADINLAQAMEPFEQAMTVGQQLTSDTLLQADTEGWQAFLAYYGVLTAMASHDAALASELQPVIEFMKVGRRKPAPEPTPE